MKKFILTLLLALSVLPLAAQVVVQPRRPHRFFSVEGGAALSHVHKFGERAQGGWHPYAGFSFVNAPMTGMTELVLALSYRDKSFTGVATEEFPEAPYSHNVHSLNLDMGVNFYPFKQYWYIGGLLEFGGNFLVQRIEPDGTKVRLKAKQLDALGLAMGVAAETGVSFSGWPFGDRVTVFARYAYDILGSPFNKAYCNDGGYGVTRKLSCGSLILGVRVPILLYHD